MLLAIDKTALTKNEGEIAQWPIYLIISNLNHEIQRLYIKLRGIMIGLISIYRGDCLEIKIEIYHQIIKVIIKAMFKSLLLCIIV